MVLKTTTKIKNDKFLVVIPKDIREALDIKRGDLVELAIRKVNQEEKK